MISVSPGDLGVCDERHETLNFWRVEDNGDRVMEAECLRCGQFEHWSTVVSNAACDAATQALESK